MSPGETDTTKRSIILSAPGSCTNAYDSTRGYGEGRLGSLWHNLDYSSHWASAADVQQCQCKEESLTQIFVLKPSNRAVNHVQYPSSHQWNSERPNTANYCSCWQIQPQNRTASCQLNAPTTVTTVAAIMTGCTDHSKVYLCFIFTAQIQWCARGSFLKLQSPRKQRRKFSLTYRRCWCFDNLAIKLAKLLCCCCHRLKQGYTWW